MKLMACVRALVLLVLATPFDSISPYFLGTTLPLGGGANAVNVIIVDYRGFDTLGEITVLGTAALIIAALLHRRALDSFFTVQLPLTERNAHPLMLQIVARLLLPLAVMVTVHLFLRGHNLPGGGFIAGLVLAIALVLLSVAHGAGWIEGRWLSDFRAWIAGGLLVAVGTGLAAFAFGQPFLTSAHGHPTVPLLGAVPLASASLFDLGVFLTVVGATTVMLASIARIPQRQP